LNIKELDQLYGPRLGDVMVSKKDTVQGVAIPCADFDFLGDNVGSNMEGFNMLQSGDVMGYKYDTNLAETKDFVGPWGVRWVSPRGSPGERRRGSLGGPRVSPWDPWGVSGGGVPRGFPRGSPRRSHFGSSHFGSSRCRFGSS
jgi:hypothetical protein